MDRVDDEGAGRARVRAGLVAATACLILAAALSFAPPQLAGVAEGAEPSDAPASASKAVQSPGFTWTETFSSERHGYSIRYPFGWTVERSDSISSPDSFTSPGQVTSLSIVRRAKPDDKSVAQLVDNVPKRCSTVVAPKMLQVPVTSTAIDDEIIDGHPALVGSFCWNVHAVVDLGDEILEMTLRGGHSGPRGDRWTFNRFAERIEIGPSPTTPDLTASSQPSPTPPSTQQFRSKRYGFSIEYPSGWVSLPSKRAGRPDAFQVTMFATARNSSRLSISRRSKAGALSLDLVAEATFPHRIQAGRCRWGMPAGEQEFRDAQIDGRSALVRAECNYIDAVVEAGEDVLVVALRSEGRIQTQDRQIFDQFMDTMDINVTPEARSSEDPSPGFTWTEPFTSERYDYSIRYPPGWIPSHLATEGSSDEFYAPGPSTTRLSIVRRPKSDDMTLGEIALDVFSARSGTDGCHWNAAGIIYIPTAPQPFEKATVAGRPALVRSECGFVDAVIDDGEDVILVVLRSGTRKPTGDRWNFDRFMETLAIHAGAE